MGTETRVAAGLKAAIHNPNVSEEAKERAADRLESMGTSAEETSRSGPHDPSRVRGGYKATLSSECRTRTRLKENGLTGAS